MAINATQAGVRIALPKPGKPMTPVDPAAIDGMVFASKDKNKDGALTLDEWMKSTPNASQEDVHKFRRYDANQDGKVDEAEFRKGRGIDRLFGEWMALTGQYLKDKAQTVIDQLGQKA